MNDPIPDVLVDAIADGVWKNPGPDVLRQLLGDSLPDLKLFENIDKIKGMSNRLDNAGYVDDPQFCMARESEVEKDDPRLIFDRALFVGGSIYPGDDVFVAADLGLAEADPPIFVFDWERDVPHRWVGRGTLGELAQRLRLNFNIHDGRKAAD